jgi:hypothetical protein
MAGAFLWDRRCFVVMSALFWLVRQLNWRDSQQAALVAAPPDRVGVGF